MADAGALHPFLILSAGDFPQSMDPRLPNAGLLPHRYDPRLLGEQMVSRGQPAGQYRFTGLPGDAMGLPAESSHLRVDQDFVTGGRDLPIAHQGPPYLPQGGPPQYAPMDNRATEQQLAELFTSQLDLLGPPLMGQIPSYAALPTEDSFLGEGSGGAQEGEEKPRSKMQEKNRRVCSLYLHA